MFFGVCTVGHRQSDSDGHFVRSVAGLFKLEPAQLNAIGLTEPDYRKVTIEKRRQLERLSSGQEQRAAMAATVEF